MKQRDKLAVCTLVVLLLTACGGSNEPTQEQRAAIGQPLFETEHKIIDRRSSAEADLDLTDKPPINPERNAYFGDWLTARSWQNPR